MAEAFTFFWKHRLSQWHRAPFVVGGAAFTHAEQYMMYAKALLFGDREAAGKILAAETPREQQAIGREVRGFDEPVGAVPRGHRVRGQLRLLQPEPRAAGVAVLHPRDHAGGGVAARPGVGHRAGGR